MKLEEYKCKNCGAVIEVKENASKATCKYCNTTFNIKDENSNVDARKKGYEFEKGRIEAQQEQFKENIENIDELQNQAKKMLHGFFPMFSIIPIIIFAIVLIMIVVIAVNVFSASKEMKQTRKEFVNRVTIQNMVTNF